MPTRVSSRIGSSGLAGRRSGCKLTPSCGLPMGSCRRHGPLGSPAKDRQRSAGHSTKPPNKPGTRAAPTASTTYRPPNGSAATAPAWRSHASCSNAATTPSASCARRRSSPHELLRARRALTHTDAPRPAPRLLLPPPPVDGLERPSGRNASPSGITPSNILSPARNQPGSRTEVSPGARAHNTALSQRAHAP
jgi:hypothetical protein